MWLAVIVILIVIAAVWFIAMYNGLVKLRVLTENAWSDVDVQLNRRHDLIPNLVETVKGYAKHEQSTLDQVIRARNEAVSAPTPGQKIEAEQQLTGALRQLFALSEAYPDLKANTNFLEFQGELSRVEESIANARRYYNAVVRDYNTRIHTLPSSLIANNSGFEERPFFEAEEGKRENVRVQF